MFVCGPGELKGNLKIKLKSLTSQSEIKNTYDFELTSKRLKPTLEVTILTRAPLTEKEYVTNTKKVLKVIKTFPPFNYKGNTESNQCTKKEAKIPIKEQPKVIQPQQSLKSNKSKEIHINQGKEPQKQTQQQIKNEKDENKATNRTIDKKQAIQPITNEIKAKVDKKQAIQPITNEIKAKVDKKQAIQPITNEIKAKVDKSQFSPEELNNPDCIENINTIEVLIFKENEINEKIKKIEGRTPVPIREYLVKIRYKKKVLEDQLGEKSISAQNYLDIIKKQLQHDKLLFNYFEQQNDKVKSSIVNTRLVLLQKELQETMEYIKENNE